MMSNPVLYCFGRGTERRTFEVRLASDAAGYELVITAESGPCVERFDSIDQLLMREHELVTAWRSTGWRERTVRT